MEDTIEDNPLDLEAITEKKQATCSSLQRLKTKFLDNYILKDMGKIKHVLCYIKTGDNPCTQWKIALPDKMLEDTVKWFRQVLGHP